MIKVNISWTSETTWDDKPKGGWSKDKEGIKEFSDEKEMIDYCLSFDHEIIIDRGFDDGIDYDVEIYNDYRE